MYLKDLWPSAKEIAALIRSSVTPEMFAARYGDVFKGDAHWRKIGGATGKTYGWRGTSTWPAARPSTPRASSPGSSTCWRQ